MCCDAVEVKLEPVDCAFVRFEDSLKADKWRLTTVAQVGLPHKIVTQ